MHIGYDYRSFTAYIDVGDSTEELRRMTISENLRRPYSAPTSSLQDRITQLKLEEDFILKTYARFSDFLESNSIAPYNDAFIEYLDHFIKEEKRKHNHAKNEGSLLTDLTSLHDQYTTEKKRYNERKCGSTTDKQQAMHTNQSSADATPQLIFELIEKLYSLPISGNFIHDQFKQLKNTRTKNVRLFDKTVPLPTNCHPGSSVIQTLSKAFSEEIVYF